MEEELKCPVCKQFFSNAVLLPCYHSLCLSCALSLQHSINANQTNCHNDSVNSNTFIVSATVHHNGDDVTASSVGSQDVSSGTCGASSTGSEISDICDKLSLLSETDSGVVCTSRPNSYVGTPNMQSILFPSMQTLSALNAISLSCAVCHKMVYLDESGAHSLPKNAIMQNIADKYCQNRSANAYCQLCESDPKEAIIMCEQCDIYYCERCRDNCHPMRGPLAKHTLIAAQMAKFSWRTKSRNNLCAIRCAEHTDNPLTNFCMHCKVMLCNTCLCETRHSGHDLQPIAYICKALKTELSQSLQALSEKAKHATEFIQRLKGIIEKANENSCNFETEVTSQCDILLAAIEARKQQLLSFARKEKDYKLRILRDQVSSCTAKLQNTTGLIQFCIEALKEVDATAYLQIGSALINRVSNVEMTWHKDMNTMPWISAEFDLTLDCQPVLMAIEQLTFTQMKPPSAPIFIVDECVAENNSITIAWHHNPSSFIEGYILELDDGNCGAFREVYCGKESICTVDGLHFNCIYRVRVKAYNSMGEGTYSEVISMQTADVAWFALDPLSAHTDIMITNENQTVSCDSYEHRVVLANIGFSRGIHYWEINIDRYQNNADIAFGVARCDVCKDKMLGKDEYGWSMYIDNKRSWFMHNDRHFDRTEGGVDVANVVGVLLNLEAHELSFYVNDERQGPLAFTDLKGVFFPAISLNRNVQLTISTGLEPPNSTGANSSIESENSDGEIKKC